MNAICEMVLEMMIEKYNTEWYNIIDGKYSEEFENTVIEVSGVLELWENKEFVQWFNEQCEEL